MFAPSELQSTEPTGNVFLDSITYRLAYVPGTQISYLLSGSTWTTLGASAAFDEAASRWSAVADVEFVKAGGTTSASEVDWIETFSPLGAGLIGQHELPHSGTVNGAFNSELDYFSTSNVKPGGYGFEAFLHEIGHGLGLLHPHFEPDSPEKPSYPNANEPYSIGSEGLNQSIFTVLSYNSGFEAVGISPSEDYGWTMGPMAFDIAAMQAIYGPNLSTNTGNTTYLLPSANVSGTGWRAIWDAGGEDTISAATITADVTIDLRAATLVYGNGSGTGGYVSRAAGVLGGFTIANGVVIENALGGSGDDLLAGNAADNRLDGGNGFDLADYRSASAGLVIDLGGGTASGDGNDTLLSIEGAYGGLGNDTLIAAPGGTGNAIYVYKSFWENLNSPQDAFNLDYLFGFGPDGPNSAMRSVTVHAVAGQDDDHYAFFVEAAGPIELDIDNSFGFDTVLEVYAEDGTLLGSNDDYGILDPGSANVLDSYLVLDDVTPGQTLTVKVSKFPPSDSFWHSYDFTIALATSRVAQGGLRAGSVLDGHIGDDIVIGGGGQDRLYGGPGDDMLTGGGGDDLIHGGDGSDTATYAGMHTQFTVTSPEEGVLLVSGLATGNDTLISVEAFRFDDGDYYWSNNLGWIATQSAPVVEPTQQVSTYADIPVTVRIGASDIDGDQLTYTVTGPDFGGTPIHLGDQFVYVPMPGFVGQDGFSVEVSDGHGGTATQQVTVNVAEATAPFRVAATAGFAGMVGGHGEIFGDAGFQDIALRLAGGTVTLDPSYNRGGDIVRVPGDADEYTVARLGSNAVLAGAEGSLVVPLGSSGTVLVFDDGHRTLRFDEAEATAKIGIQAFATDAVAITAPPEAGALPDSADPAAKATIYLQPGTDVTIDGRFDVIGSAGQESINWEGGIATFDPSFNRGGDIIRFTGMAEELSAYRFGSSAVLLSDDGSLTIPFGEEHLFLGFGDDLRTVYFDWFTQQLRIDSEAIFATDAESAQQLTGNAAIETLALSPSFESQAVFG